MTEKFRHEGDVREWIRDRSQKFIWVEPTLGSTVGAPDVWVVEGDGTWIELKYGERYGDGLLRFKVRTPQKREIEAIREAGGRVGVLVGFDDRLFVTSEPGVINRGWVAVGPKNTVPLVGPLGFPAIIREIGRQCSTPWRGRPGEVSES